MLLELTSDQESLRATTAKYLEANAPVGELRRLREDPAGYGDAFWRGGADLGWTSLLVSEERGGGNVSGNGLIDATLLAYEFGQHAAPGPFLSCNLVAAALTKEPAHHDDVLRGLLAGTSVASWCLAEGHPGGHTADGIELEIRVDGDTVIITGVKRPVESAAQARHLLVTGRTDGGFTQVLVPSNALGLSMEPMKSVDLTRRFWEIRFEETRLPLEAVVGGVGNAHDQIERQLQQALVLLNAESVGAMQAAFDMTVEWAFDRYSFGRPLASYQELKHRFADMKTWLEASHAIADASALAVGAGSAEAGELVSAAKAYIGHYGAELLHDCVQIHGGIGVTFEHDLHLYLRRVTLNRAMFGTPADHRRRITDILEDRESDGAP
jgi:alkylation response protein AidB-like acyl-CoA dehydrogenase